MTTLKEALKAALSEEGVAKTTDLTEMKQQLGTHETLLKELHSRVEELDRQRLDGASGRRESTGSVTTSTSQRDEWRARLINIKGFAEYNAKKLRKRRLLRGRGEVAGALRHGHPEEMRAHAGLCAQTSSVSAGEVRTRREGSRGQHRRYHQK